MNFKTRRIRKEPKPKKQKVIKEKTNNYKAHYAAALGSLLLISLLIFGIYSMVSSLDFSKIVFSFGKELKTDETGHTNILLLGTGGKGHDGANLTDTIIIASIDYKNKSVSMLSIPRDLYIMDRQQRINSVYDTESRKYKSSKKGLQKLEKIVEEITGTKLQYYVKVDFNGFIKIIDSIGGVDIMVEHKIYDPYYPKGETIYFETFKLDAGQQVLNGKIALKYARSRKTTSDFDRAKRQQKLLFAIKEKAMSLNILTDAGKLGDIYNSIDESIETDMALAEIIELGKLGQDFQKDDIIPLVLNDDPTSCGGLLYTPVRDYFSGASVLLQAGNNYDYIHFFTSTVLPNIKTVADPKNEVQILNGTKTPGLAYEGLSLLSRFCINVVYYGNTKERPIKESTIYYSPDKEGNPPKILETIKTLMPKLKTKAGIPEEYLKNEKRKNSNIVIELGNDYLTKRLKDPFKQLKYTTPVAKTESDSSTKSTQTVTTTQETT